MCRNHRWCCAEIPILDWKSESQVEWRVDLHHICWCIMQLATRWWHPGVDLAMVNQRYSIFYSNFFNLESNFFSYVSDLSERRGQKKKAKGVRFDEAKEKSRPGFGLVLLRYLLSHVLNRAILLKKNLSQLEDIKNILMVIFKNIFKPPKNLHS